MGDGDGSVDEGQQKDETDHLKKAEELLKEVRKPLMRAGRMGVVNPELAHKIGMAQQQISMERFSVEVHRDGK